jgi:hypothetical protein
MDKPAEAVIAEAVAVLRQAGAVFAYLHGSRAAGRYRAGSDVDIAAYFGCQPIQYRKSGFVSPRRGICTPNTYKNSPREVDPSQLEETAS